MLAPDKCFWGYGYTWNRLSHYNGDAMQSSLTTMKSVTACEQALHLRDIERCEAKGDAGAQPVYSRPLPSEKIVEGAEGRGRLYSGYRMQGAGKEIESSLARFLATRTEEVATNP